MGCNCNFRQSRDCNRFWDDLVFCRHGRKDCDECHHRRNQDCDCDECRRKRNRNRNHGCNCNQHRNW
ncbi:hypothetical protein [Bacillus thuringiensis]|uniref:Uncharacterized protein n=1 Tax=Bacillus thuringiensis TaxID=1428 RepID=A0A9X6TGC2_BACTU|nr:hypothetical protein [Bacillus thuringiensis]PEA85806.1 hypothetical protein CON71_33595 [Bacillus thuringiensis]